MNGVGNASASIVHVSIPALRGSPDLARRAPYLLAPAPEGRWAGSSGLLTDGGTRALPARLGGWVGWNGTHASITVDLGRSRSVAAVTSLWLQNGAAAVRPPASVTAWASAGGSTWRRVSEVAAPRRTTADQIVRYCNLFDRRITARFLRIRVPSNGEWLLVSQLAVTG